jgi:hypothetical protein
MDRALHNHEALTMMVDFGVENAGGVAMVEEVSREGMKAREE